METPIVERYSDGQVILTEGVVSQKAYIIISGEVAITKKIGNRNVTVGMLKEGDVFGEMGLFQDKMRSASAMAKGDVSVGVIDKERFNSLLLRCPGDMKIIINSLIDRLRGATDKLAAIGLKLEQAKRSIEALSTKEDLD